MAKRPGGGPATSREAALAALIDVDKNGAYARIALDRALSNSGLDKRDRAFATELVYGTLRSAGLLDHVASRFSRIPVDRMDPEVRSAVRMGLYQMLEMDAVPAPAAVYETVEAVGRISHKGAKGFVNAVLRAVLRSPDPLGLPDREKDPAGYIAVKYSHPRWLVERWVDERGAQWAEALAAANNVTPPVTVRVNLLRTTREEFVRRAAEAGITARPSELAPEAVDLMDLDTVESVPGFSEGFFQVQDVSGILVSHILAPEPGETVVDACAAPGGKTTHIAQLMADRGTVLAFDIHQGKLRSVAEAARRLGLSSIRTEARDARELGEALGPVADRVLVDAPCTGLGVLRRRPDLRWRKSRDDVEALVRLAREILESAARCVKPGGLLVFSTCTITPEENERQVEDFLASHPEFEASPIGPHLPCGFRERFPVPDAAWYVTFYPHVHGIDGGFAARMRRRKPRA